MYQILLADDEPIVLEGLCAFPWEDYGCTVAAQAKDGIEGLKKLKELHPHIVITDIRMPGLSGIEFARQGKELLPHTEFVILTGYADFNYARDSLKIGVSDYLLKPFNFSDIKAALLPMLERIQKQEEEESNFEAMRGQLASVLPVLREQVFQSLLEGSIMPGNQKLRICGIPDQKYVVFSTQSDHSTHDFNDLALYAILQEAIGNLHDKFYLAKGIDTISCVLCFQPHTEDHMCESAALNFCLLIQESVDKTYHFSISVGISQVSSDIFKLKHLREQSIKAMNQKYMIGGDLIMLYSDIRETQSLPFADYAPLENLLHKSLITRNEKVIVKSFEDLAALILHSSKTPDQARTLFMSILFHAIHFLSASSSNLQVPWSEISHLSHLESMEAFAGYCLKILMNLPNEEKTNPHQYITDKIFTYIEQNYEKEVSLETLSRQLNYSTTYLSRLIKKNCEKNFTDLLLDCRMNHAKDLLKNSHKKINQIANSVGYGDISYFISLFKKKTGVTPSEYRVMHHMEQDFFI